MVNILVESGADIETKIRDIQDSPLSLAMKINDPNIVNYLLSKRKSQPKLNVDQEDKDQDPLFSCISQCNLKRVKIICQQIFRQEKYQALIFI